MADLGDHNHGPEPYKPTQDAPTTPFQRVEVPPAEQTIRVPRPQSAGPFRPPPAPPRRGLIARLVTGIGDVPIKLAYLVGAVVVTVLAVVLVFVMFSGDQPDSPAGEVEPGRKLVPVPSVTPSAGPTPTPAPTPTPTPIALPPVPERMAFKTLPGKASKVSGRILDKRTTISYPRLGKPWKAKSFPPFSVAQRIGKVAIPHTMVVSAMLPGDAPAEKPKTSDGYRDIAVSAVRWSLRTQHPAGSTITWTGSQKMPVGKGWMLGYQVRYTVGGKPQSSQALAAVIEIGRTKPAMLLASIPESGKSHWRDINTLVKGVRPV